MNTRLADLTVGHLVYFFAAVGATAALLCFGLLLAEWIRDKGGDALDRYAPHGKFKTEMDSNLDRLRKANARLDESVAALKKKQADRPFTAHSD